MKIFTTALLCLYFTGCAQLHSVSITEIPQKKSRKIEAQVSRFIFLAFNFDNDYVPEIINKLKSQCKNGRVEGILTKDESYNYFLAHKRVINASGYCIKNPKRA